MEEKAHEYDYNIMFCSELSVNRSQEALNFLLNAGVDGLIFASVRLNDPRVERLIRQRFQLVLVNRKVKGTGL